MANIENKKPGDDSTYDTRKSYNQLVYGRYVFLAKLGGIAALVILALYLILTNIGKSLRIEEKMYTIEQYLSLAEKQRAQFRVKLQMSLLADVLRFRADTMLIAVDDPKYLLPETKGAYDFPEERAILGCKLDALELALKRSLTEMQYPFVYTRIVMKDDLKNLNLDGYYKYDAFFPVYISKKIQPCYKVVLAQDSVSQKVTDIYLPDSIAAYFKDLYSRNMTQATFDKYIGTGPAGAYKNLTIDEFDKLAPEEQQEQRRAFLAMSEADQNKARSLDVGISADYECYPWDEPAGAHFKTLIERKIHELEVKRLLSPYYNHATFSLIYPMGRVHFQSFIASGQNANSIMLVGLKSGRAPAQYKMDRKDCPKIIVMGMFADITDIIKDWDQIQYFPKTPMKDATYNNRIYGIPATILMTDCIQYRRDWLEEPGIIEWFKKKGWMHPVDKRPYIPLNWTYSDFRTICKLMSDNDPKKKRKGFEDRPGPLMYLDAYSLFHFGSGHYMKPNPTMQTTWVFKNDDPIYLEGMKTVHDMYWFDKSIRTGVEINYTSAQDDFNGGRLGMSYTVSSGVVYASLMRKYDLFGKDRPFSDIVGMTSVPGCSLFPNMNAGDCNMTGFNPRMNREQLKLAVEWIKKKSYGDFVKNSMYFEVKEAKTLGSESVLYRNAIASVYSMDYNQFNVDFRSVFSPIYLDFYDDLRASQKIPAGPSIQAFGLTQPLTRAISEQVETMFQKAMMDSVPNYERILRDATNFINTSLLNFKDENALEKLKAYYAASADYYRKNFPDYYDFWQKDADKYNTW